VSIKVTVSLKNITSGDIGYSHVLVDYRHFEKSKINLLTLVVLARTAGNSRII